MDFNIQDKSIAIIGNAESLFEKDWTREINEFDLVIRMNKGTALSQAQIVHTTSRCDIYCTSEYIASAEQYRTTDDPKVNMWMTNKLRETAPSNFLFYPLEWWDELQQTLGQPYRPTTGYMVIDMIQRTDANRIGLFGFDFWKTKTFYNQQMWTPDSYSPDEHKIIQEIMTNDKRFHHYG